MQDWFHEAIGYWTELLEEGQAFTARLDGEDSDSVRVNGGRIRQCGSVVQRQLRIRLIHHDRQVTGSVQLAGVIAQDRFPLRQLHSELSALLEEIPPDPHLVLPSGSDSTEVREECQLPPIGEVLPVLGDTDPDYELVGHYMAGRVVKAFATSLGMRRWYETHTFDLEASLCLEGDRAAKFYYGGVEWKESELTRRLARATEHVQRLGQPRVRLEPGSYRAYIAPVGLKMIYRTLGWRGAFSYRAQQNGTSPFGALHRDRSLSSAVSLTDDHRLGWTAPFNAEGFPRPEALPLIEGGRPASLLVAPRTGAEFGVPDTGSDPGENPSSLSMGAGNIAEKDLERTVGDGLWLEFLHYLNLSDRESARVTGLTRFAAFRVRDGALAEPVEVARFDDSVLELLGDRLVGLTEERQRIPEGQSYAQRSLGGAVVPGAVVEGLRIVS